MIQRVRGTIPLPLLAAAFGLLAGLLLAVLACATSPTLALCGAAAVMMVALVLAKPAFGMLLTAVCVPLERLGRMTSDNSMYTVSLIRLVGTLTLGALFLHIVVQRKKVYLGIETWMYGVFVLLSALSLSYTADFTGTVKQVGAVLGNLMFLVLVVNVIRSPKLARAAVIMWLLSSVGAGLYTMYDWHVRKQPIPEPDIGTAADDGSTVVADPSEWQTLGGTIERALGPTSHSAVYGINLILTIPFFVFFIERGRLRQPYRLFVLAGLAVVLYNIFLTNTRASMLIAALVLGICALRKLLRLTLTRLAAVGVLIVALLPFVPGAVWERVLDISNYTYENSGTLRARLEYWDIGLRVLETHWWQGTGAGDTSTVPKFLKNTGAEQTSVHNEYLETLMESGVFAWALFFTFVFIVVRDSFRAAAEFKRQGDEERYWFMVACQNALIAVLIFGVQVDVFHFPLKGWWMVAGISIAMRQVTRASANTRRRERAEPEKMEGSSLATA